ncbi:MAG: Rieske (2Fe-2S) protein [Gammaproteobacteria bacterium]|nr:Rieske (2Fe-2S) protein [Gammaproteobacteria bacterium]
MSAADPNDIGGASGGASESPQPLIGFMSNEEWERLLVQVSAQIGEMEKLPFPEVRDKVFELLAGIDSIHREALRRLVRLFKEGVMEQVVTDPAIHTLMELYDLLPQERPPAGDSGAGRFRDIPIRVVPARRQPSAPARYPHWVLALQSRDRLPAGSVLAVQADEQPLLLCRKEDELFAVAARCPRDGGSLAGATLNGYTLICPNHEGCYYDVRQGSRIGGDGGIECYPVRHGDDDRILVGLGMEFKPSLPAF